MALTPFVADTPTTPDESGSTFDSIKSQWNSFLSKPEGQAALLSFGINLMQPPSFGDNPLAQDRKGDRPCGADRRQYRGDGY